MPLGTDWEVPPGTDWEVMEGGEILMEPEAEATPEDSESPSELAPPPPVTMTQARGATLRRRSVRRQPARGLFNYATFPSHRRVQ
jgi:hypothetical protein